MGIDIICKKGKTEKCWGFTGAGKFLNFAGWYALPGSTGFAARCQGRGSCIACL